MQPEIFLSLQRDIKDIIKLHKNVLPHLKWSYKEEYIEDIMCSDNGMCWSLYLDYKLIGAFHFYCERRYLWLNTIAIFKKYQGRGYGRMVMGFVETEARDFFHFPEIRLWCLASCEEYYKNLGYKKFENGKKWKGMKKVLD